METKLQVFAVTVEADSQAAFKARLDHFVRSGLEVASPTVLGAGVACGLRISSTDGNHKVAAEAAVVKQLPGEPVRLLVTPTRFGKVVSRAAQVPSAAPAAAAPIVAATPAEPAPATDLQPGLESAAPEGTATAAQSLPVPGSSPGSVSGPSAPGPIGAGTPSELKPFEAVGNYQVLKHLGGGGMAEVYLARSLLGQGVDKVVALKTVRNEFGPQTRFGSMFLDEARVSATLQHPNIVQVFDFGEAAGRPYLAMEFVAGRDLVALIRVQRASHTPAPPAIVVAIGIALCRALEYVHEKKDLDGQPLHLVHRDVGPANVLVTARSEVKLMDFGVAATQQSATQNTGMLVGKLPYMPPEQLAGEAPSPGWDLYPVGVTLYQLATLVHPYQGNPADYLPMPTLRFHRGPPSQASPGIPPSLDALLVRATQLESNQRAQSAKELREELEKVQPDTGPGDVGAWVKGMFGEVLAKEEAEHEVLMAEARRRTASRVPAALRPLLAPFAAVRRRVVYSNAYRSLARRPWALRSLGTLLVVAVLGGVGLGWRSARERATLREQLARADAQIAAGRLVRAGTGDALELLLNAKARWPGDARAQQRLSLLAAKLEAMGTAALERGNLEEAGAHFEAALRAEPRRPVAREKLKAVEESVRERSRDKVIQSP